METITKDTIKQLVLATFDKSPLKDDAFERMAQMCNRYITEGKRPLRIFCIVSGSGCAMTAKALFAQRIADADNDIVKLVTTYIGRSGGRLLNKDKKKGKSLPQHIKATTGNVDARTVKAARKIAKAERAAAAIVADPESDPHVRLKSVMPDGTRDWFWRAPGYVHNKGARSMTLPETIEMVKETCHRSDLSVSNCCNECQYVLVCACKCKTVIGSNGKAVKLGDKGEFPIKIYEQINSDYPTINRIGESYFLSIIG